MSLLELEEGALLKLKVYDNKLVITAAKDISLKDKFETDALSNMDNLPEKEQEIQQKIVNKISNNENLGDLTAEQYDESKKKFETFFQNSDTQNTMKELLSNPVMQNINKKLCEKLANDEISMDEFQQIYLDELKKLDLDLYNRLKGMQGKASDIAENK